jgi:hypothetical protein
MLLKIGDPFIICLNISSLIAVAQSSARFVPTMRLIKRGIGV